MDRRAKLLSMFDPSGFGLEIGPSYNPLLPKADGYNVETLDHASQDGLREHYAAIPGIDINRIEPVDFVSDGRSMRDVIGETHRYDFVVASHVIEHTPNMVGFLQDCESLLKPRGVIVLIVPDKRYCFDKYRPHTSLGQIVAAHEEGWTRHSRACLFDHHAYFVEDEGRGAWPKNADVIPTERFSLTTAKVRAARHADGPYIDSHAWQFTPNSFRSVIEDLHTLGSITFRELAFQDTDSFEFFCTLAERGRGPNRSRKEILDSILTDLWAVAPDREELMRQMRAVDEVAEAIRRERDALRAEVTALRASTSWRITKPLRGLRGG